MSVDDAALQVAQNMEEAERAAGPSAAGGSKKAKGKVKKRTRKSRRI
jgi:hypothetical protein